MQTAFRNVGSSAELLTSNLTSFTRAMRASPGLKQMTDQLIGHDFDTSKNKAQDLLTVIRKGILSLPEPYQAAAAAARGISMDLVDLVRTQGDEIDKSMRRATERFAMAGVDQGDLAAKSHDLMKSVRDVSDGFKLIGDQAFMTAYPAVNSFFNAVNSGVDGVLKYNRDHPGFALYEATAVAATSLKTVMPLLSQFGIHLADLGPWGLAAAAAVSVIIANWDTLGPYFDKKWKDIQEAYKAGGWEAAARQVATSVGEVFSDALKFAMKGFDWIVDMIGKVDWKHAGEVGAGLLRDAFFGGLNFANQIYDKIASIRWDRVGETIGEGLGELINWFANPTNQAKVINAVINAFAHLATDAIIIGASLAEGIIEGLATALFGKFGGKAAQWIFKQLGVDPESLKAQAKEITDVTSKGVVSAEGLATAEGRTAAPTEEQQQQENIGTLQKVAAALAQPVIAPEATAAEPGAATPTTSGGAAASIWQTLKHVALGTPSAQHGGIVNANLHHGEMVLPADISQGLQMLVTQGGRGMGAPTENRADRKLMDWLGDVGVVPKVAIENFEDMFQNLGAIAAGGAGALGEAAGTAGRGIGRVARGAAGAVGGAAQAVGGAVGGALAQLGKVTGLGSLLARGESRGDYNIYNRGTAGRGIGHADFSQMTVGELSARGSLPPGDPHRIFAFGKYQIIPSTLRDAMRTMGLKGDEKMTPELQEKIFTEFLIQKKRPEIGAYLSGKSNDAHAAAVAVAKEWASVAHPDTGRSVYGGVGGNKASISAHEVLAAMQMDRDRVSKQQQTASAQHGGILMLGHQGEMVLPQGLSSGLARMMNTTLGGGAIGDGPGGAMNGGDRNITMNVTHNVTVNGHPNEDPNRIAGRYGEAGRRLFGDAHRNLKANVA
jgi:hypothetical protein